MPSQEWLMEAVSAGTVLGLCQSSALTLAAFQESLCGLLGKGANEKESSQDPSKSAEVATAVSSTGPRAVSAVLGDQLWWSQLIKALETLLSAW